MKEVTERILNRGMKVRVHGEIDEQKQRFIDDLTLAIAQKMELLNVPGFLLEVTEYNCTKKKTTMHLRMETMEYGVAYSKLFSLAPNFKTTAIQRYDAVNWGDDSHDSDYRGRLTVCVTMKGCRDAFEHVYRPCPFASMISMVVYGSYYAKILQHYPEWTTHYRDAPRETTVQLTL